MKAKDLQMAGLDVGSNFVLVLCPNCCEAFLVLDDLHVRRCPYCQLRLDDYARLLSEDLDLEGDIPLEGEGSV